MQAVGYRVNTVEEVFGERGIKDPQIIAWCGESGAVWIHADDNARREHAREIVTAGISTVWIPRGKYGLSIKDQLGRLAYRMQAIEQWIGASNRPVHLVLRGSGTALEPRVTLKNVSADQNRRA